MEYFKTMYGLVFLWSTLRVCNSWLKGVRYGRNQKTWVTFDSSLELIYETGLKKSPYR
jgi:hypothetical protein